MSFTVVVEWILEEDWMHGTFELSLYGGYVCDKCESVQYVRV